MGNNTCKKEETMTILSNVAPICKPLSGCDGCQASQPWGGGESSVVWEKTPLRDRWRNLKLPGAAWWNALCGGCRCLLLFLGFTENHWEPGSHDFERSTCAENGQEFRCFLKLVSSFGTPKMMSHSRRSMEIPPKECHCSRWLLIVRRCMSPTPCWRSLFELWCWRWTCYTKRGYPRYKRQGVFFWGGKGLGCSKGTCWKRGW